MNNTSYNLRLFLLLVVALVVSPVSVSGTNAYCNGQDDCRKSDEYCSYSRGECVWKKDDGSSCNKDYKCLSGYCNHNGRCESVHHSDDDSGDDGYYCEDDHDCNSKYCNHYTWECVVKLPWGHYCYSDRQCHSGYCTNKNECGGPSTGGSGSGSGSGNHPNCDYDNFGIGKRCQEDCQCRSNYCDSHTHKCAQYDVCKHDNNLSVGKSCQKDCQCRSHYCNSHTGRCDQQHDPCDDHLGIGRHCDYDCQCNSGYCDSHEHVCARPHHDICDDNFSNGRSCEESCQCRSGLCLCGRGDRRNSWSSSSCYCAADDHPPPPAIHYCHKHKDCSHGYYCDFHSETCKHQKQHGKTCKDKEECRSNDCECDCFLWVFNCLDKCYCEGN